MATKDAKKPASKPKPKPAAPPDDDYDPSDEGGGDEGENVDESEGEGESSDESADESGDESGDEGSGEESGDESGETEGEGDESGEGEETGEESTDGEGEGEGETGDESGDEPEPEPKKPAAKKPYPVATADIDPSDYVPLPPQTKVPEGLLDCFGKYYEKGDTDCEECVERQHCLQVRIANKPKGGTKPAAAKPAAAKPAPAKPVAAKPKPAAAAPPAGDKPKFHPNVAQLLIDCKWKAFPAVKREVVADKNAVWFSVGGKRRILFSRIHLPEFRVRLVNVKEKMAELGADKTLWEKQDNHRWMWKGKPANLPAALRNIFKTLSAKAEPTE